MKRLPILPAMTCAPDCGECCTIVPITTTEAGRIERYAAAHGIKPREQIPRCPWYQDGACAVYEVRPIICRLFGHAPKVACSYHPERANDLPDVELDALVRRNGRPEHLTHGRLAPGELPILLGALRTGVNEGSATAMRVTLRVLERAQEGST